MTTPTPAAAAHADLVVTTVVLEDSVDKLGHIRDELEHQKSDDRELSAIYGQWEVQKAMHDFSGDWKIHRGKIKDAVVKLHDQLQNQVEQWSGLDQDLGAKLQTEQEQA